NEGVTTVIYTITDASSNTATCNFTVTVNDNESPTIACAANQTHNVALASCDTTVTMILPTVGDNCGIDSTHNDFTTNTNNVAVFPVGTTTVQWTTTDNSGNTLTCTQDITVVDDINPTISCVGNQTQNVDAGNCTAVVSGLAPAASNDNCAGSSIAWVLTGATSATGANDASGETYNEGLTTVTYTITDASSNTATCNFTVTVSDNENPTITCGSNQSVNVAAGTCAQTVTINLPLTADNCGEDSTHNDFTGNNTNVALFPLGATVVEWTTTDNSGNTNTCTHTITITDNIDPVVSCPSSVIDSDDNTNCGKNIGGIDLNSSMDNCSIGDTSYVLTGATTGTGNGDVSGTFFDIGETTVTYTVTDGSSNTETCQFTVTLSDTTRPAIICASDVVRTASLGQCQAFAVVGAPTVQTDNCTVASILNDFNGGSANANDFYGVGTTVVTWIITDNSGNTNNCTQNVTVNDTQDPTISCPGNQTQNVNAGNCTAVVNGLATTASDDNCPGPAITWAFTGATVSTGSNDASGEVFNEGLTTVTYTITDASSNTATCNFTVTVNDNENPTIACAANQTHNVALASCDTTVTMILPTVGDNCGIDSTHNDFTTNTNNVAVFPVGTTTVQWTTTDNSGNTLTCNQDITVVDDINPTISCVGNQTQNV
ncbi:MAG: HYR domain-containing protein, partial [Rhizobiaceae bacterium]|nr:HYR domain-containing protein [Rhizobiaceae bacterium]